MQRLEVKKYCHIKFMQPQKQFNRLTKLKNKTLVTCFTCFTMEFELICIASNGKAII